MSPYRTAATALIFTAFSTLVVQAHAGDQEAALEVADRLLPSMQEIVRSWPPACPADERAAVAHLKAHVLQVISRMPKEVEAPKAYLTQALRREHWRAMGDDAKRRGEAELHPEPDMEDPAASPEETLINEELQAALAFAMLQLPDRDRLAVEHMADGVGVEESAEVLGVSTATVKRSRAAALRSLRLALTEEV